MPTPLSLREVPEDWRTRAFSRDDRRYCLRTELRAAVHFCAHDLCAALPDGPFHLILGRNLAFTYFGEPLQRRIARHLMDRLAPGGFLVVGIHERRPPGIRGVASWRNRTMIVRRTPVSGRAP